ncbi:MAG: cation:proton antiporter [Burkholderiales bacterium]
MTGFDNLAWFALVVLLANLAGELFSRVLRLPRLLGWIAAGVVLGPAVAGVLDEARLPQLRGIVEIAVALVLFELGQRVDLGWLRRNPWLLATSVLESALTFAAIYGVLWLLDAPPLVAATAAAIGMATAPAVVLTLSNDLRAHGQVTERALLLTALNCAYAFVVAGVLLNRMLHQHSAEWQDMIWRPLYTIFGSLGFAGAATLATLGLLRLLGRSSDAQLICVIAVVVLSVSLAHEFGLYVVLVVLAYGVMCRAFDSRRLFVSLRFGRIGDIAIMSLFALTAASLDFALLPAGALAGAALVAARYAGKWVAVMLFARMSGLALRKASLLSLALMPMSAVVLLLVRDAAELVPQLGQQLATVIVSAVVMLELLGPLVAHFALVRSGEAAESGKA